MKTRDHILHTSLAALLLLAAGCANKEAVQAVRDEAKKNALSTAAIFPAIMLVCYLALIIGFRMKGGYRSEEIGASTP